MNKKTLLAIGILIIAAAGLALFFLRSERPGYKRMSGIVSDESLPPEKEAEERALQAEQESAEVAKPPVPREPVLEKEDIPSEQLLGAEEEVYVRKAKPEVLTHRVVQEECLWLIASQESYYGDPLKWVWIYAANSTQIIDPDLIYPGQMLSLPLSKAPELTKNPYAKVAGTQSIVPFEGGGDRQFLEHFVLWSESLWKIAGYEKYYSMPTQWFKIYQPNKDKIDDSDLIYPKQLLRVPMQGRAVPSR